MTDKSSKGIYPSLCELATCSVLPFILVWQASFFNAISLFVADRRPGKTGIKSCKRVTMMLSVILKWTKKNMARLVALQSAPFYTSVLLYFSVCSW